METKCVRATEESHRCQATASSGGQCLNRVAVEGGKYCLLHGGNKEIATLKTRELKNYRLAKWRSRIEEKVYDGSIKNLHEEIGILRIILEETLNRAQSVEELLIFSPQISDLTVKIERLVTAAHKLDLSLRNTLELNSLLAYIDFISRIIHGVLKNISMSLAAKYPKDEAFIEKLLTQEAVDEITQKLISGVESLREGDVSFKSCPE